MRDERAKHDARVVRHELSLNAHSLGNSRGDRALPRPMLRARCPLSIQWISHGGEASYPLLGGAMSKASSQTTLWVDVSQRERALAEMAVSITAGSNECLLGSGARNHLLCYLSKQTPVSHQSVSLSSPYMSPSRLEAACTPCECGVVSLTAKPQPTAAHCHQ